MTDAVITIETVITQQFRKKILGHYFVSAVKWGIADCSRPISSLEQSRTEASSDERSGVSWFWTYFKVDLSRVYTVFSTQFLSRNMGEILTIIWHLTRVRNIQELSLSHIPSVIQQKPRLPPILLYGKDTSYRSTATCDFVFKKTKCETKVMPHDVLRHVVLLDFSTFMDKKTYRILPHAAPYKVQLIIYNIS